MRPTHGRGFELLDLFKFISTGMDSSSSSFDAVKGDDDDKIMVTNGNNGTPGDPIRRDLIDFMYVRS
ncbi:hypothetical protein TWF751_001807 [Orbilia oligospora]|nr:hypothetical protein TWF751_001807 [Orbilia oligospora]